MDRVFSFLLWPKREARRPWKQGRKKRGSLTCHTDRANEANKMFIIWLCWLFRFWKGDRELEVRTATYGPGIDQSQHAKSFSHIIIIVIVTQKTLYMANSFFSAKFTLRLQSKKNWKSSQFFFSCVFVNYVIITKYNYVKISFQNLLKFPRYRKKYFCPQK